MNDCEVLRPRWDGPCIVAATGKSLTKEVAEACRGCHVIAVKQAWMRFPWADVLYACDAYWWDSTNDRRAGPPRPDEFSGERWSSHDKSINEKLAVAKKHGLRLVKGRSEHGLSEDPSAINYGQNTGFQAIGLAIHWLRGPRKRIGLVGFDMAGGYFFGEHPKGPNYGRRFVSFMPHFERVAKAMPEGVEIVNCTPGSALQCFPTATLEEFLRGGT